MAFDFKTYLIADDFPVKENVFHWFLKILLFIFITIIKILSFNE